MKRRITLLFLIILLGSLLAGCTGTSLASSWPGVAVNQDMAFLADGSFIYAVKLADGSLVWKYPEKADAKKIFYAPPALVDGQVVGGDYGNNLISINAADGKDRWSFTGAKDRYVGSPLVLGNLILAPNADRNLYAIDTSGTEQWKFTTNDPIWAQPVTDGKTVFVASMDHFLYAIDPANKGAKLWFTDLGAAVAYSLTISADKSTLFAGTVLNEMIALDTARGKILWRFKAGGNIWAPAVQNGDSIFFGDQSGKIYALSIKDGSKQWEYDAGGPVIGAGAVIGDGVAFPSENNSLVAVDFNGKKLWNQTVNGKLYSNLVYPGDKLVVPVTTGDNQLLLVAYSASGSQVWAFNQPK